MANGKYSVEELSGFREAAQSLKLYRRAELLDEAGRSLINTLYVDLLPEEHVFKTMLKPHTTFLIGRKGTGKSTVFQRVQEELKTSKIATSAYIDIKTIYESSQAAPLSYAPEQESTVLQNDAIRRLLLYRSFLSALIGEIKNQLKDRLDSSLLLKLKESFTGSVAELFEGLDELLEDADSSEFLNVTGLKQITSTDTEKAKQQVSLEAKLAAKIAKGPQADASLLATLVQELSSGKQNQYSEILLRVFNVNELLNRLKTLLGRLGISQLFLFIDDFSELPEPAMRVVVETVLAPMNNWSDELIKLKVAAYPGRIYYGPIDKTKIDEIYLDVFKAYGTNDVSAMEEKAIDFTKRLVTRRFDHYCHAGQEKFFDRDLEEIWRVLFYASMGNPRILGYVLYYLYESQLIFGSPIGLRAIRDAARRYYEEEVEAYFAIRKFLHETFEERSSIFSLKELLEQVVTRAKELRRYRESSVMKSISGQPPSSHFHVSVKFDSILSTLELNFFVTKYFEMSNRDGVKVSVYALSYGLCQKHAMEFGRPRDRREYRLYFVERSSTTLRSSVSTSRAIKRSCVVTRSARRNTGWRNWMPCSCSICSVPNVAREYAMS